MAETIDYKSEILNAIRDRFSDKLTEENTSDVIAKCSKEIDRMQDVEGLEGKPIIDKFYSIWKANRDKQGHENKVNSWTAYYLGMTNKKPSGEFLPLRRAFARKGFPDIDSDFDYEFRDDIYRYIIEKYGKDNVSNIGTYQSLQLKSLIKRMFKALDPDKMYADTDEGKERWKTECNLKADEIVKSLPKQIGAAIKVIGEDGEEHTIKTIEDAYKHCKDFRYYINKYPDLLRHSKYFKGLVSGFGVHAAGIVISSDNLNTIAPLRTSKIKSGNKDSDGENEYVFASQYAYEDLESMGLIKFDILALTTLSVIARTVKMVKENYGIDIDVENMNLEDQETFKLYKSGQLMGVFQCEKPGMQRTMRSLSPDRFEDIIAGVALYRPGPMDSVPQYAARKRGDERINYFHPSIEPFVKPYLETTYGVLTYQEQVMQICNSLAGFSIGDGYAVIKAVGKKVKSLLDKYKTIFINGCVNNKVPKDIAEQYWEKFITPFASYGFNKSHAACYGYMSYTTAYLKAHYPEEFMVSHLNVFLSSKKADKYEKVSSYESEMQHMGMEFLPKSINKAEWDYIIYAKKDPAQRNLKSQIRPSIRCKGLSGRAAKEILAKKPYKDMKELAFNTDPKCVDAKAIESLALAGFFRDEKNRKRKVEDVVSEFNVLRNDMKKAKARGVESDDIFG